MIEINLLPVSMRKTERTPLPRLLTTYVGIVALCLLSWINLQYLLKEIPEARRKKEGLQNDVKEAAAKAKRLDELEAEIQDIGAHVNSVKSLYRERAIWSKLLYDIKAIFNVDEALNRDNPDRKYLWMTDLKLGKGQKGGAGQISLDCFASAPTTSEGATLVRSFMNNLQNYAPEAAPEEQMRKTLQDTVQRMEYKRRQQAQETEDGALPPKTPEQLEAERQLGILATRSSGRIATRKFADFFYPGSFDFTGMTWSEDAKPSATNEPGSRWKFTITMLLKPPAPPPVAESRKSAKATAK